MSDDLDTIEKQMEALKEKRDEESLAKLARLHIARADAQRRAAGEEGRQTMSVFSALVVIAFFGLSTTVLSMALAVCADVVGLSRVADRFLFPLDPVGLLVAVSGLICAGVAAVQETLR